MKRSARCCGPCGCCFSRRRSAATPACRRSRFSTSCRCCPTRSRSKRSTSSSRARRPRSTRSIASRPSRVVGAGRSRRRTRFEDPVPRHAVRLRVHVADSGGAARRRPSRRCCPKKASKRVAAVTTPTKVHVFTTPTCPHCPRAVAVAHEMAFANPNITAFAVEATEFPDLARRYQVTGVPKTVVDDAVEILGALPPDEFVLQALAPAPHRKYVASASLRFVELATLAGGQRTFLDATLALALIVLAPPHSSGAPSRIASPFPSRSITGCRSTRRSPSSASAPLELRMSRVVAGPLLAARFREERLRRARHRRGWPRAGDRRGRIRTGGPCREHGERVTVRYKVFGDRVDGTYLAIDTTHAHINMPAAIMWARGLDDRPVTLTLHAAGRLGRAVDSRDAAASRLDAARVHGAEPSVPDGQPGRNSGPSRCGSSRSAAARSGSPRITRAPTPSSTRFVKDVREDRSAKKARSTESSRTYEPGYYTFLADYLPYADGDGMEHRNSTVMTSSSIDSRAIATRLLDTVAHEFFHCWNVERIRPRSLEPFDFDRANMSGELWLAEGFTQYYGPLRAAARRRSSNLRRHATDADRARRCVTHGAGARRPLGGGHEPHGAVHRRRPADRSHELVEHRHLVLSVRRRHRARARSYAARAVGRPGDARRLTCARCGACTASRAARAKATSTVRTRWPTPKRGSPRSAATARSRATSSAATFRATTSPTTRRLLRPAGLIAAQARRGPRVVGRRPTGFAHRWRAHRRPLPADIARRTPPGLDRDDDGAQIDGDRVTSVEDVTPSSPAQAGDRVAVSYSIALARRSRRR